MSLSSTLNPEINLLPNFRRRALFVIGMVLFVVAEGLALTIVIRRSELNLQIYLLPYLIALWVPLPLLVRIQAGRFLRKEFAKIPPCQTVPSSVLHFLDLGLFVAYFLIIFSLILLLIGMYGITR